MRQGERERLRLLLKAAWVGEERVYSGKKMNWAKVVA